MDEWDEDWLGIGLSVFSYTECSLDEFDKNEYILIRKRNNVGQIAILPKYNEDKGMILSFATLMDEADASLFVYSMILDNKINFPSIKDHSLKEIISSLEEAYSDLTKGEYLFAKCSNIINNKPDYQDESITDFVNKNIHVISFRFERRMTETLMSEDFKNKFGESSELITEKIMNLFDQIYLKGDIEYE